MWKKFFRTPDRKTTLLHFLDVQRRKWQQTIECLRLWLSKRNSCLHDTKSRIVWGHQRSGRESTKRKRRDIYYIWTILLLLYKL